MPMARALDNVARLLAYQGGAVAAEKIREANEAIARLVRS